MVLLIAVGAYLRAKKAAVELVSKQLTSSIGPVSVIEDGPKRPELVTHTSKL